MDDEIVDIDRRLAEQQKELLKLANAKRITQRWPMR